MQTRLFACLAGGFLGVVVAFPSNGTLGLSPTVAFIGCSSIGIAVGYVASILFDVSLRVLGAKYRVLRSSKGPGTQLFHVSTREMLGTARRLEVMMYQLVVVAEP